MSRLKEDQPPANLLQMPLNIVIFKLILTTSYLGFLRVLTKIKAKFSQRTVLKLRKEFQLNVKKF